MSFGYIGYNFDNVLYQFLEIGTSDRTNIGHDQLIKWLGFSLYPFHLTLTVPLKNLFNYTSK